MDCKIVIAMHKPYEVPTDPAYFPLQVGALGRPSIIPLNRKDPISRDDTGDNISAKNASYCELTGLYWAWKNLRADVIGLVHYRRYFMRRNLTDGLNHLPLDEILTEEEACGLMERYDIVVPKKQKYYIETLYSHYAHTHYREHLDLTREIIREQCPQYLKTCDRVYRQRSGYMFNMFLMRKELADEYCSWLFPILEELENRMASQAQTQKLSAFQGRFYGRVSEILFNVWLAEQKKAGKTVCEADCIFMERIDWWKKGTSFLKAKFFGKKYEGSF